MSKLRAILFVSSARHRLSEDELTELMRQSELLNATEGVTGVLLYSDGSFMQYLEGPPQAVEDVYQRICTGGMQTSCILLCDLQLEKRMFSAWEMAFAQPTRTELLARSTAAWRAQRHALEQKVRIVPELAVLQTFWANAQHGGY